MGSLHGGGRHTPLLMAITIPLATGVAVCVVAAVYDVAAGFGPSD